MTRRQVLCLSFPPAARSPWHIETFLSLGPSRAIWYRYRRRIMRRGEEKVRAPFHGVRSSGGHGTAVGLIPGDSFIVYGHCRAMLRERETERERVREGGGQGEKGYTTFFGSLLDATLFPRASATNAGGKGEGRGKHAEITSTRVTSERENPAKGGSS